MRLLSCLYAKAHKSEASKSFLQTDQKSWLQLNRTKTTSHPRKNTSKVSKTAERLGFRYSTDLPY